MVGYYDENNTCPSGTGTCPANDAVGMSSNVICNGTLTGGSCGGQSVLLSCGAFSFRKSLLAIDAIGGISWNFALNYLAGNGVNDILGKGFNYPQFLQLQSISGGSDVQLVSGNSTVDVFTASGDTYTAADGNCTQAELFYDSMTDMFTLNASSGATTQFYGFSHPAAGRLNYISDRYGSKESYTWAVVGGVVQLASETDAYGRTISYSYYGSEFGYKLQQITDFLGRQLNFQYDALGHLVAVITPSILKAATGNTFPGGTAYVFQYDAGNARTARQDDLIKIWYPNEATPFIDPATRTVDVAAVYASATPRYTITYGQDPTDEYSWGLVTSETVGDPTSGVGGTFHYLYAASTETNPFDDPVPGTNDMYWRCIVTDRNDNQKVYDFNMAQMPVRVEEMRSRGKINIPSTGDFPSYVTWTQYNTRNQPVTIVPPEGNSIVMSYDDGMIDFGSGAVLYNRRAGLLLSRTASLTNPITSVAPVHRPTTPSSGQTQLTDTFFYDPVFNRICASIERRGNPIDDSDDYFTPQNGGTTPTDSDRSRYATFTLFDYQKNQLTTISGDPNLQSLLFPTDSSGDAQTNIETLISLVDTQMLDGGIPASGVDSVSFQRDLGDINGDGTGDGDSSGLQAAQMIGNVVKIQGPTVNLISPVPEGAGPSGTTQARIEIFTTNNMGQTTTHTDANGNLTVFVRYPYNDPEGNGGVTATGLSSQQYGRMKEIHVDANPNDVLSLIGSDGDLVDFIPGIITRYNTMTPTPVYQDLVTRFEGGSGASGAGCSACAYDPMGNPLATTDPRGFTTRFDRNELGEIYRTISPQPYNFLVENYFDANRNIVRVDTQDMQPKYDSSDPSSADYGQFSPSGSNSTAHVPMQPGPGGSVRPGWFTNLFTFDLLDNKTQDDIDATGSNPANLITSFLYDPNQNLIQTTKPNGNIVEYDYDERNLKIAVRVGRDDATSEPGAITVIAYDGNRNVLEIIGPADRGGATDTATIEDAFRSGSTLSPTGDLMLSNSYDGFDRVIQATDPLGNYVDTGAGYTGDNPFLDPDGRVIQQDNYGNVGGGTDIVLLASVQTRFDEAGRAYEDQKNVFIASGGNPVSSRPVTHTGGGLAANSTANDNTATVTLTTGGTSYVLTRTIFDAGDRQVQTLADNTSATTITLDGASREISIADAMPGDAQNVVNNIFDASGNLISTTSVEQWSAGAANTESFTALMFFDSLNQMVLSARQGADGNLCSNVMNLVNAPSFWATSRWNTSTSTLISCMAYDSRGNNVLTVDPKGNSSVTVVDGASRTTQTQQQMRLQGQGNNPPAANQTLLPASDGTIVTTMILDGNGNRLQLIDDRGDITAFEYDTLDREVKMIFHDGSTRTNVYDEASDVTTYTDENGSVFTNQFDSLGRKFEADIVPNTSVGVAPTTITQVFGYDGLSRMTTAIDSNGTVSSTVTQFYDSLSRMLEDSQLYNDNTRNVTNTGFASYPVSQFTFPNGRVVDYAYDALYRRTNINEDDGGANIASWNFFGPSRVAEILLGNGLAATWMNNARANSAVQAGSPGVPNPPWGDLSSDRLGYDGSGRAITKRYLPSPAGTPSTLDPDGSPWTPPQDGLYEIECYGSGGNGDNNGGVTGGGGGGGGGYVSGIALLSGSSSYSYNVDTHGSAAATNFVVSDTVNIVATSGQNASGQTGGAGGSVGGQAGDDGIDISGSGGNGGSAAGPGGGAGGVGGDEEGHQHAGDGAMIGGGGGGEDRSLDGVGNGADGAIILTFKGYMPTTPVVGFTTAFDRASNKFYERALHAEERSSLYEPFDLVNNLPTGGYDSADRLLQYQRGTLSSTGGDGGNGGGSVTSGGAITLPGTDSQRSYLLDGLGNWRNTGFTPVGGSAQTEVRQNNGLNQITRRQNASTQINLSYDGVLGASNGNLANDGTLLYQWDALNRLVQVNGAGEGNPLYANYVYDALNRRIEKTVTNGGLTGDVPNGTTDFIYSGWRCVEDRNPDGGEGDTPLIQYIWGEYLDELIQLTTLISITTGSDDETTTYEPAAYYPLQDLLYRTTATTDALGNIVESYDADVYGNTLIFNAYGTGPNWWASDAQQSPNSLCQFIFTGQRFDAETGNYYYKRRYFSTVLGRFLSCDPLGVSVEDVSLYQYVGTSPSDALDPLGLQEPIGQPRVTPFPGSPPLFGPQIGPCPGGSEVNPWGTTGSTGWSRFWDSLDPACWKEAPPTPVPATPLPPPAPEPQPQYEVCRPKWDKRPIEYHNAPQWPWQCPKPVPVICRPNLPISAPKSKPERVKDDCHCGWERTNHKGVTDTEWEPSGKGQLTYAECLEYCKQAAGGRKLVKLRRGKKYYDL